MHSEHTKQDSRKVLLLFIYFRALFRSTTYRISGDHNPLIAGLYLK